MGTDEFLKILTSKKFEQESKDRIFEILMQQSRGGDIDKLAKDYLWRLNHFKAYFNDKKYVPRPSASGVDAYLEKWQHLENYQLQEEALNKLFYTLAPNNTDISDVLLKAATLNDFYSTNIFSIYPVAKHILSLNIDDPLQRGDIALVSKIQCVEIGGKQKNFYSFATKYCSHHNPEDYPIYDSYVDEVLRFFRKKDKFAVFKNIELKDYARFKEILIAFQTFYNLEQYNLKQIDQFLWLFGKTYFPNKY